MAGLVYNGKSQSMDTSLNLKAINIPLLLELKAENILKDPIYLPPQFRDLSALSVWMSLSLYINKFDMSMINHNLRFLLV